MQKVCEQCGQWFRPHKNVGKHQRFCSEECQRQWWLENRSEAGKVYRFVCQNCGKEYETLYSNRDNVCSRECGWELHSKRAAVTKLCLSCGRAFVEIRSGSGYCSDECRKRGGLQRCVVCDSPFHGHSNSAYCSEECKRQLRREQLRKHREAIGRNSGRIEVLICKECGTTFERRVHNRVPEFCSKTCQRTNWERNNPDKASAMKAKQQRKRRAMKCANGPVDSIDFDVVCARDGWRCGICGRKVRKSLKFPHPMSASLDHIVPLSKGGTHTWQNVQCAHFICNSRKSDVDGGQLRLGITIDVAL